MSWWSRIFGGSRPDLGLDLGGGSIKICAVTRSAGGPRLTRLACVPVTTDPAAALAELCRAEPPRGARVAFATVASPDEIVRTITIPLMTDEELAEQIRWEAELYIPQDPASVLLYWRVARREDHRMEVLLCAAPREPLTARFQELRSARFEPRRALHPACAAGSWLLATRPPPGGQTVFLLDLGATRTVIATLVDGGLRAASSLPVGGDLITARIMQYTATDRAGAELLKRDLDEPASAPIDPYHYRRHDPRAPARAAAEETSAEFAAQVARSLAAHAHANTHASDSKLVLTGGGSRLQLLTRALERATRLPVELWDPCAGLAAVAPEVDQDLLREQSPGLAVALGLATTVGGFTVA